LAFSVLGSSEPIITLLAGAPTALKVTESSAAIRGCSSEGSFASALLSLLSVLCSKMQVPEFIPGLSKTPDSATIHAQKTTKPITTKAKYRIFYLLL
jgi:hypothetical protein